MARKISTLDMTPEQRAEHHFHEKEREYNKQWDIVNSFNGDVVTDEYGAAMKKVDKLMGAMFRAFDNWQHMLTHKFTASPVEAKQLILDALMSGMDALPDVEEMTGLERHRHAVSKADDLVSALKGWGVSVRAHEFERPPMCGTCSEELGI